MLIKSSLQTDTAPELAPLIARAQRGEISAFGDLYDRYAMQIVRFLYQRTDLESAKDLTQEVFMRVMKGIGSFEFRDEKSFLGWLYKIAANVLIGQARRKQRVSTPLDENLELIDPRSQEHVLATSDRILLQHAMSQLTADQQQVLNLKFYADFTNQEIAVALGRSEGAVKALQYRALQSLQQILQHEFPDSINGA